MFCDAYCMISRPVVVSPVNATFWIRELEASGLPASKSKPVYDIQLRPAAECPQSTPSGTRIESGVCSAGFSTTRVACRERRRQLPGQPSG